MRNKKMRTMNLSNVRSSLTVVAYHETISEIQVQNINKNHLYCDPQTSQNFWNQQLLLCMYM